MNLELNDRNVLIVGGTSGIGLAAARAFACEGANVAIWDCSPNVYDVAKRLGEKHSVRSLGIRVDVVDKAAIESAQSQTIDSFGHVDHLVLAAAVGSGKFGFPFTNLQPRDWGRVLDVNVMGMVNVAHIVAPHMVNRGTGTMVFIASVAGQMGSQSDPPYSASKAANINFAQCLSKDLASFGIRVNTVCPGMVQTPLTQSVWQAWYDQAPVESRSSFDEWSQRKIQSLVPLGKWQSAEAIADMIIFLSSARTSHVTGQTINVDGGMVMHS